MGHAPAFRSIPALRYLCRISHTRRLRRGKRRAAYGLPCLAGWSIPVRARSDDACHRSLAWVGATLWPLAAAPVGADGELGSHAKRETAALANGISDYLYPQNACLGDALALLLSQHPPPSIPPSPHWDPGMSMHLVAPVLGRLTAVAMRCSPDGLLFGLGDGNPSLHPVCTPWNHSHLPSVGLSRW